MSLSLLHTALVAGVRSCSIHIACSLAGHDPCDRLDRSHRLGMVSGEWKMVAEAILDRQAQDMYCRTALFLCLHMRTQSHQMRSSPGQTSAEHTRAQLMSLDSHASTLCPTKTLGQEVAKLRLR